MIAPRTDSRLKYFSSPEKVSERHAETNGFSLCLIRNHPRTAEVFFLAVVNATCLTLSICFLHRERVTKRLSRPRKKDNLTTKVNRCLVNELNFVWSKSEMLVFCLS